MIRDLRQVRAQPGRAAFRWKGCARVRSAVYPDSMPSEYAWGVLGLDSPSVQMLRPVVDFPEPEPGTYRVIEFTGRGEGEVHRVILYPPPSPAPVLSRQPSVWARIRAWFVALVPA